MQDWFELTWLGIVLFVTTNIDDLFVLIGFFADSRFRRGQIVIGQFVGNAIVYLVSVAASLLSLVIDRAYIGLLGVVPIAIGILKLKGVFNADKAAADDYTGGSLARNNVIAVAAVTVASGGDNLSIYTPVFANRSGHDVGAIGIVFIAMTLVWLLVAAWLTQRRTLSMPLRHYGHRVLPFVLIVLGAVIIYDAGTLRLLRR
jgi:cadmium resistance protein CadD (predicted permease)